MNKLLWIVKSVIIVLLLIMTSGCWDQTEVDRKAYVVGIGLDKGKKEKINITYLISNPEYGSQQGGNTNEPATEIITFEANDLITSRNIANSVVAKQISYDMLSVIIVSKQLAKDKNFIRWMYDATKDREIKRNTSFLVTKEKASSFIEQNEPKLETRPHKYFTLIFEHAGETGLIPKSDLMRYFRITEADGDLFLAALGTNRQTNQERSNGHLEAGEFQIKGKTNKTNLMGSAVFKEGRMIGELSGEETRLSLLLNDTVNSPNYTTTFQDPFNKNYDITAKIIKNKKNDVSMRKMNRKTILNIKVPLTLEVLTDHSMVNYAKNKEKRYQLKAYLTTEITEKLNKLVVKTQKDFKGQPFGWSLQGRKYFLTVDEYEKYDWMKSYPSMEVKMSVEIRFGEFGRQTDLPKLKQVRD
ncbi:Ger(x)C family spore germination protein [Fictibacillus halophilus]|uniref:Ger(x)C family spore germination protein n=1 Tax=Fictibacillus halophilus TaxID=1610490 RepID=UPI001CFB5023|nr:Ger(x)C family spore germination protein [Fictibacillus halophilus]